MRYHFGFEDASGTPADTSGGKMLRPALCLLCCEAVGGDLRHAMPAAAAIELVHNFTLIHDDIEDASDTPRTRDAMAHRRRAAGDQRRRRHVRAGAAHAPRPGRLASRRTRVLDGGARLNEACTAVCEGQHRDIEFETRDRVTQAEYVAMIDGKTGALLGASVAIGAIRRRATTTAAALGEFGRLLGMAFQIQDDVLGIWGEADVTGKPVADDIRSRKRSFPIAWAFEHLSGDAASTLARIYGGEAIDERDVDTVILLLNASRP